MTASSEVLGSVPLLEFFSPEARKSVASLFTTETYRFGEELCREGEPADAFFVLVSGRARVFKKGKNGESIPLNILKARDEFGEGALFVEGVRNATVRCSTEVTVLKMKREDFQALLEKNPELRDYLELRIRNRELHNFLQEFSALGRAPLPVLRSFLASLREVSFPKGTLVIGQDEPAGPMYIIKKGRVRVYLEKDGQERNLAFLRAGDFFGERSTFIGETRAASVQTLTECQMLALSPESVATLFAESTELRTIIEERIAQYDATRQARIPLDFSEEMLPAEAVVANKVAIDAAPATTEESKAFPFTDEEGHFRKKKGRIRRFPFVQQIDAMDCGSASLAMVCRHYGKKVSLARIRQLAHTAYDGTSLKAICRAASELGLAARAVKIASGQLDNMPLPAIIHWQGNHWMVLVDVGKKNVKVADPATGIRSLSREDFLRNWSGYGALFDYTTQFEEAPEGKNTFSWVVPFIKPFRSVIAQVALLAVVASCFQLAVPIFTQIIVDRVVVEGDVGMLHLMLGAMACALFFMLGANLLQRYMVSFAAVRIDAAILDFLTRKMLALPMSYFHTRRTGDIQRRLAGAREVRQFVVQNGIGILLAIVQIIAYFSIMAAYSFSLFMIFLITAPLYVGLMAFSAKFLKPLFTILEESQGRYASYQIDAIKGIEAVKAAGAEHSFRDTMLNEFVSLAGKQFRSNFIILAYSSSVQGVGFLSNILFLWAGASLVMAGKLTIGSFMAFNSLVAMTYVPIMTILSIWDQLQRSSVLMARLNDIFEQVPEQGHDRSGLLPVRSLEGKVEFRNLSFRFGGAESPLILKNLSLEVPAGRTVAIVGRSGCGKTTLIKCLAGLLEPSSGGIYFDDVDIRKCNLRDLRQQIGMVLQDNYVFDDTIFHNIAFGDPEPDMDKIIWAARIANAHGFIMALPLNYETKIGETGLALSGGQKQRIVIARALYRNPPILIFDEATSALDTESERAIQENLSELLSGRTAFVIAHRLSTIRHADTILVLEKGELVEQGSHDELMELRGLYFYLVSRQLGM